jgi:DNA-binding transcriptional LysR family regulator
VLNIAPAAASAAVKRLEAELGVRLLARSTRSLALTQEGERYLEHARRALADLQAGQDALALGRQAIGGEVSLSIPSDLGRSVLAGWLDDFLGEHPAVALQVRASWATARPANSRVAQTQFQCHAENPRRQRP